MSQRSYTSRTTIVLYALLLTACGGGGGNRPAQPPAQSPPTISLSAPSGGVANRTVNLTADVTAAAGVTRVEFLVDGTVIGTSTTSPYTVAWDTSTVADGAHSVTARVTDGASNVVTSTAASVTVNNNPTISVALSTQETFPEPTSGSSGSGELTFNLLNGAVSGGVTVSGINATMAHIHQGYAGATGPILVNFAQSGSDQNRWDAQPGSVLTATQIDDLLAGRLYVNVHSAAFPSGEIRGQLKPDNIEVVFTPMTGDAVVPAVTTAAAGVAAATIDTLASNATVHANTTGVDDATEAHVHKAAVGANNSAVLITLAKDSVAAGHWSAEGQAITAADLTGFSNNGWYIDVHTPANPAGEIRGQLEPNPVSPPAAATLTELQASIFSPQCSSCHTGGGGSLPASMNLSSASATFAALVNVASSQQPAVQRVQPGNPDSSYVVLKLQGAAGINGSRMPLGGPFLDAATIDQVRSWIAAGAANN